MRIRVQGMPHLNEEEGDRNTAGRRGQVVGMRRGACSIEQRRQVRDLPLSDRHPAQTDPGSPRPAAQRGREASACARCPRSEQRSGEASNPSSCSPAPAFHPRAQTASRPREATHHARSDQVPRARRALRQRGDDRWRDCHRHWAGARNGLNNTDEAGEGRRGRQSRARLPAAVAETQWHRCLRGSISQHGALLASIVLAAAAGCAALGPRGRNPAAPWTKTRRLR